MTLIAFDADQDVSHVAAAAIAKGVRVFYRYLKNLTPAEVAAIFAAGAAAAVTVWIVSIFETTAERALQGAEAGDEDAQAALRMAAALGQPSGSCICFTADFGEVASQDAQVLAYFAATKAGMAGEGTQMIYGEGAVCQAALDAGVTDFTWVAGGRGMRGTEAFLATGRATAVQDVGDAQHLDLGISIDSGTVYADEFGGWSAVA